MDVFQLLEENVAVVIIFVCTIAMYFMFFSETEEQRKIKAYRNCKKDLMEFINKKNCNPILVRLAWHDSGTFDKNGGSFPECGGANGSIRFPNELNHGANAGLSKAVNYLRTFKSKYPEVTWADLIQMGSACSIEHAGGPKINMKYGRCETSEANECPKEGNLPNANGLGGSPGAAQHLRDVFHRMGFTDQEIVALSGAHTLGRAFADRSGVCPEKSNKGNKFTTSGCCARLDGHPGIGMSGGRAWTADWLTFNNSYFQRTERTEEDNDNLLWVETDQSLIDDKKFGIWYQRYAKENARFMQDYAKAHKKLSELGCKFSPKNGFAI